MQQMKIHKGRTTLVIIIDAIISLIIASILGITFNPPSLLLAVGFIVIFIAVFFISLKIWERITK